MEIIGNTFLCNLSEIHLNLIDPFNLDEQTEAFKAGAISVATLLHHKFTEPRYQESREFDPIVGVSFTGLFDFFVKAFGVDWLRWWDAGRPNNWDFGAAQQNRIEPVAALLGIDDDSFIWQETDDFLYRELEKRYLESWRKTVEETVWDYCDRHNLKRPNRCTTVQPAGSKSLLTGASSGWHPPKAARFIRRITFAVNDPVALACIDYGYSVVPAQSDKDESGVLLTDPFDPRVTEWLVEIPVATSWADLPGVEDVDINQFSALAQIDFYLQVQKYYVRHNTSATVELRENEIKAVGDRIYQAIQDDEGYISACLLSRDDSPFPRLPYEKIDKETYERLAQEVLARRRVDDFHVALAKYDQGEQFEASPAGCDSDKCMFPEVKQ